MLSAKPRRGMVQAQKYLPLQTHLEVCQVRHHVVGQPFFQQLKSPCKTTHLSSAARGQGSAGQVCQTVPLLVFRPVEGTPLPL